MTRIWANLSPRERLLIVLVVPLALILGVYQFAWRPVQAARAAHAADIATYRLLGDAARAAARDAGTGARPVAAAAPVEPIATRVTRSAETTTLQLRRLEPEGTALRVTLDDAAFSDVILWISDLEVTHDVLVAAIEIDRRTEPGIVTARLLLESSR